MSASRFLAGMAFLPVVGVGCTSLQRPEIRSVRSRITAIDLRGVSLMFDVEVNNPYLVALKAPRFQYAIDIEGNEFIKSESPVDADLPAGRVGTISLPVRFGYVELWRTYRALADATEAKYQMRATFPVSALGQQFNLPVSHSGTIPVLRPPQVSMGRVRMSDVSVSGAKVIAEATLRNPNAFSLGLNKLGYTLTLGDVPVGSLTASTAGSIAAGASGKVDFGGEITARAALLRLLQGASLGEPKVSLGGAVETPYGLAPMGSQ
jgi:LEA14-like dessication related protein